MTLPFDTEQLFALIGFGVMSVLAYAELKSSHRDYGRRTERLEGRVEVLEQKAEDAARIKQSVETLTREVRAFSDEMKANRTSMSTLENAIVRLETTLHVQERR